MVSTKKKEVICKMDEDKIKSLLEDLEDAIFGDEYDEENEENDDE